MPQVEFHSGVAAPVHFACRLLRKAFRQKVAVVVMAEPQTLTALDRELWTFEAQEFLPHVRLKPGQGIDAALRRTPIWLCEDTPPSPSPRVLVNLGVEAPGGGEAFDRIIEVVPPEGEARAAARRRWRAYEARGWDIRHHPAASG